MDVYLHSPTYFVAWKWNIYFTFTLILFENKTELYSYLITGQLYTKNPRNLRSFIECAKFLFGIVCVTFWKYKNAKKWFLAMLSSDDDYMDPDAFREPNSFTESWGGTFLRNVVTEVSYPIVSWHRGLVFEHQRSLKLEPLCPPQPCLFSAYI